MKTGQDIARINQGNPSPANSGEWAGLSDCRDEARFCAAWLSLQTSHISGVNAGLVLLKPGDGSPGVRATWPAPGLDLPDLFPLAERALTEGRTVTLLGRSDAGRTRLQSIGLLIAVPLGAGETSIGVAAFAIAIPNNMAAPAPEIVAEQIRWGAGWFEAIALARRSVAYERLSSSLDILAIVGEQQNLRAASIALVNDLADRLRCDRVSLGLAQSSGFIRIQAISRSASFRRQSRLVQALSKAMEEAADQGSTVALPPSASNGKQIALFHRQLLDEVRFAEACILTVPLSGGDHQPIGALLFERHRNEPFDSATQQLLEAIAVLLAPIVALQMDADRMVSGRLLHLFADGIRALTGPRRPSLKLGFAGLVAAILFVALASGEHRLTAKSVLEGEVQRAAVAPFDGFIRTAPRRAGDHVKAGELLAKLDDKDFVLDQLKAHAELEKLRQKQQEALAKHDRIPLTLLAFQIKQAESQLALANEKLARTRIVAPVSGLVVSGDLSQMLGSPVERGKVLFEVAPLDRYRLIINLDERDIRFVAPGQRGSVMLAGSPTEASPFQITKVTPVAASEDGRNSFRVEAALTSTDVPLRPGLEGIAKVEAGSRSLIWIWTHATLDWLRLNTWKYAY